MFGPVFKTPEAPRQVERFPREWAVGIVGPVAEVGCVIGNRNALIPVGSMLVLLEACYSCWRHAIPVGGM